MGKSQQMSKPGSALFADYVCYSLFSASETGIGGRARARGTAVSDVSICPALNKHLGGVAHICDFFVFSFFLLK